MKIIGITGKSGSGKTTFASLLANELNCKHIDVDKIGHEALLMPEVFNCICEKFGTQVVDENGNIDRKKLGDIAFTQRHKKKEISDLTWKYMKQRLDSILSQDDKVIVLEWILLPHTTYWSKCDCKVLVTADDTTRKERVLKRDKISDEYFNKRESTSIEYSEISFDYVLKNDYQEQTMKKMVDKIREQYIGDTGR